MTWNILKLRLPSDRTVRWSMLQLLSWRYHHSPAEYLALHKPLSALTSCLTPPHPVDNCCFFSSFSFPLPSTWQQMRHPWRRMTRQQPSPTYSELLSICSLGKNRWAPMEKRKQQSVRTVSVSDNCLGQQNRVGLKVSAKAIGVTALVVCYFQSYVISHCTCTHT